MPWAGTAVARLLTVPVMTSHIYSQTSASISCLSSSGGALLVILTSNKQAGSCSCMFVSSTHALRLCMMLNPNADSWLAANMPSTNCSMAPPAVQHKTTVSRIQHSAQHAAQMPCACSSLQHRTMYLLLRPAASEQQQTCLCSIPTRVSQLLQ